jgi:hypothetical protein
VTVTFQVTVIFDYTMKKRRYIHHLLAERDKFEQLLNQLSFSRLTTTAGVAGPWSVKDIVAHIMSYEQFTADRMAEIIHRESYTPASSHEALDAFLEKFGYPDFGSPLLNNYSSNHWIVEKYKNISLEEVVAHEIQAFSAIITAIETLSESQLDQYHLFEQITNNTYIHYREHSRDIERWLISST